ncbi:ABC transporter ATP-binding protein [Alicyclobacillus fastidiosus]|uniref:ABC transporter ATP-binding protein n=1 Tax=Alicyclobacillus fastidiosus TaxID=392011 RepID=UPI0023EA0A14|nr:ABC transporter ATP-binding protein [Alicyclobacillus fastidiosus]GMA61920.1 ABC transporter ATP-binding protein [Alicyclobacillus fastidiosus]
MSDPVLELKDVSKYYRVGRGLFGTKKMLRALQPLSFAVARGEILSIVGESGCGKSTLGKLMSFVTPVTTGEVTVDGKTVHSLTDRTGRDVRRAVQIVHQDPYAALNPRKTVGSILITPIVANHLGNRQEAKRRAVELLELVGLHPAANYLGKYPFELSGGQRQRVVIARALTVNPKVIVADEAVSMIDVSLRQSILTTLKDLRTRLGVAVVFITHDLALARHFSAGHNTMVMYAGQIVEYGPTEEVIENPRHPYTAILRSTVLDPDPDVVHDSGLKALPGELPDLNVEIPGCPFVNRCPLASDICHTHQPHLQKI